VGGKGLLKWGGDRRRVGGRNNESHRFPKDYRAAMNERLEMRRGSATSTTSGKEEGKKANGKKGARAGQTGFPGGGHLRKQGKKKRHER